MKVSMLWHGGANYAAPRVPDDVERFDSMRDLLDALERRKHDPYYPCAYEPTGYDDDGRMTVAHVFVGHDDIDEFDAYPDRVVTLGPRGGFRVEHT